MEIYVQHACGVATEDGKEEPSLQERVLNLIKRREHTLNKQAMKTSAEVVKESLDDCEIFIVIKR